MSSKNGTTGQTGGPAGGGYSRWHAQDDQDHHQVRGDFLGELRRAEL